MHSTRSEKNEKNENGNPAWRIGLIGLVTVALLSAGAATAGDRHYDPHRRTTIGDSPLGAAALVATVAGGLFLVSQFDGHDRHVEVRHKRRHFYRHDLRRHGVPARHYRAPAHRHSRSCGHAAHAWSAPRKGHGHGHDRDHFDRRDRRDDRRKDRYDGRRDNRRDDRRDRRSDRNDRW